MKDDFDFELILTRVDWPPVHENLLRHALFP